jgi:hypothetical protein
MYDVLLYYEIFVLFLYLMLIDAHQLHFAHSLIPSPTSGRHFILAGKMGLVLICRFLGCESANPLKPIRLQWR